MATASITSDLALDSSRFLPSSISESTAQVNALVEKVTRESVNWTDVGAQRYRELGEQGKTPLPKPVFLDAAKNAKAPSRDPGRDIPLRVYTPDNNEPSRGIALHIHGGGFVLGSHLHVDPKLQTYANSCQITAISVGYRLAPEHPYPAGPNDCFDAAEYLVDHGREQYGADLFFITGESSGGNLTVLTALHLLKQRPEFQLKGIVMPFGWFDLTLTLPSAASFDRPLIVNTRSLREFREAYVPGWSVEQCRNPSVSPLYTDLQALASSSATKRLPPALMLCGTEDPMLDETLLMGTKWLATGSDAVVKIYPGGCHGFLIMPGLKIAEEGQAVLLEWLQARLAA